MSAQIDLGKIRTLRKRQRLTQLDMARALGYKTETGYHYIETGKRRMSAEHLAVIANLLGVQINDLQVLSEKDAG